jgi:lipopolysaccharide transport system permease protein
MAQTVVAQDAPTIAPKSPETPVLVVEGGPGRLSFESLRELWLFREVYSAFVVRAVKVRYKQAAVGIGWAVVQPIVSAVLFTIVLSRVAHVASDGTPYLLFALAGFAGWTYFAAGASASMEALVSDQVLLRKVYFPREILPFATGTASLVDLVPGVVCVAIAAAFYGIYPTWSWLLLPLPILLLLITSWALGLSVSALNVYYRDVRYVLPFLLQLGMIASFVIVPLSKIPASWRTEYAVLNPVATAIDDFRLILLHGSLPWGTATAGAFGVAFGLMIAAFFLFKRLERGFADRV